MLTQNLEKQHGFAVLSTDRHVLEREMPRLIHSQAPTDTHQNEIVEFLPLLADLRIVRLFDTALRGRFERLVFRCRKERTRLRHNLPLLLSERGKDREVVEAAFALDGMFQDEP